MIAGNRVGSLTIFDGKSATAAVFGKKEEPKTARQKEEQQRETRGKRRRRHMAPSREKGSAVARIYESSRKVDFFFLVEGGC